MALRASTSAGSSSMKGLSIAVKAQLRCATGSQTLLSSTGSLRMRGWASSAVARKSDSLSGSNATPARRHREGSSFASEGPEMDGLAGEPKNASTASTSEMQDSLSQLADITRKIGSRRSSTLGRAGGLESLRSDTSAQAARMMPILGSQRSPLAGGMAEGAGSLPNKQQVSSPALAPSGYSFTHVPRKADPTIKAFVNNLMRDGKKATTTRYVLDALRFMAHSLHADPMPAFREAVELASPLIRMQTRKQGGKNTQVPLALFPRQSRRRGIIAIIEASKKRGDGEISVRLAKEIMAVLDGSSSALTRKDDAHKLATVNRGNTGVRV